MAGFGDIASAVTNAPSKTVGFGGAMASDPARAARAAGTFGGSEIYGQMQAPAKKKAQEAEDAANAARQQGYATVQDYLGKMGQTAESNNKQQTENVNSYLGQLDTMNQKANQYDQTYSDSLAGAERANQGRISQLMSQAQDQANNAQKTYTNSIQPSFKNAMEKADEQAGQAMSLNEAGDMNNKVQQGVRAFFDQQAANAGRSGMQDVGMLQALGAQANAQQMGAGVPMTGAQMQLMQAGNASQAGQAFANVQRRMQSLKDQGIAQGIQQSSDQYARGQQAVQTAANQRNNFMGAEMNNQTMGQNARGEIGNFGNTLTGSQRQQASDIYGGQMSQMNRGLNELGVSYNMKSGLQNQQTADAQMRAQMGMNAQLGQSNDAMQQAYGQQAAANAQLNAQNQMLGSVIQAGGAIAGGMAGGQSGAAMGGQLGGIAGQGVAGSMNAQNQNPYMYQNRGVAAPQGASYYGR